MKILVYDVAAESGGALSILNKLYELAANVYTEHEWIFLISLPNLENCKNIIVRNFPEVKKGWLSRLKFDKKIAPRVIQEYNPDVVVNLQNVYVKTTCKQILYMHQPLPFTSHRFSIFDFKLWVYQNIIGNMIKNSCKKCDEIIVQTEWIKDSIIKKCKVSAEKIKVKAPEIDNSNLIKYNFEGVNKTFFYPASGVKYKNHITIIKSCKILKEKKVIYEMNFTLKGNENKHINKLKKLTEKLNLNVKWLGSLSRQEVYEMYSKTVLLFPSYIETFGLPLLEARESNCPIIAAETEFAKEILNGYEKTLFFNKFNSKELAYIMEKE